WPGRARPGSATAAGERHGLRSQVRPVPGRHEQQGAHLRRRQRRPLLGIRATRRPWPWPWPWPRREGGDEQRRRSAGAYRLLLLRLADRLVRVGRRAGAHAEEQRAVGDPVAGAVPYRTLTVAADAGHREAVTDTDDGGQAEAEHAEDGSKVRHLQGGQRTRLRAVLQGCGPRVRVVSRPGR